MTDFEDQSDVEFSPRRFFVGSFIAVVGAFIGYGYLVARENMLLQPQDSWIERLLFVLLVHCIGLFGFAMLAIGGACAIGIRWELLQKLSDFLITKFIFMVVALALFIVTIVILYQANAIR